MSAREPRTLRPPRVRWVLGLVACTLLSAFSIAGLAYGVLAGLLGLAIFGLGVVGCTFGLLHPRSLATRLDAQGFRAWNVWGRPMYAVPWERVAEFGVMSANRPGSLALGTARHVAFRCEPPLPGRRHLLQRLDLGRFERGLPDEYGGFDATLALMLEYARESGVTPAAPAPDPLR